MPRGLSAAADGDDGAPAANVHPARTRSLVHYTQRAVVTSSVDYRGETHPQRQRAPIRSLVRSDKNVPAGVAVELRWPVTTVTSRAFSVGFV